MRSMYLTFRLRRNYQLIYIDFYDLKQLIIALFYGLQVWYNLMIKNIAAPKIQSCMSNHDKKIASRIANFVGVCWFRVVKTDFSTVYIVVLFIHKSLFLNSVIWYNT